MSGSEERSDWTEDEHDAALMRHNKLFCKSSKSFNQVYDFYPKDAITFREAHDTVLMVPTATSFVPGAIAEPDVRKKIARKRIQLIKDEEAAFDDQVDDQNLRYEFFHVSMAEPVRLSHFKTVYPARLITNTMLVRRQVAVAIRSYGDYQKFSRLLCNWINVKQWYDLRVANLDFVPPLFGDYVQRRKTAIESFLKVLILNRVVFQIPLFHLFLYTNKSLTEIESCMKRFDPDIIASDTQDYEKQYFPRPLSQREIFSYSELAKEREAEMAYDAGSDEVPDHFWTPELSSAVDKNEKRHSISDDGSSCTDEDAHRMLVSKSFLRVGTEERVVVTEDGVSVYSPMPAVSGSCPDRHDCLAAGGSKEDPCDVKGSKRIRLSSLRSVSSATALSLKATPRRGSGPESSSLQNNETSLSPTNEHDSDNGLWMDEKQQQHEVRLQQQLSLIYEEAGRQEEEEEIMVISDGKFDH